MARWADPHRTREEIAAFSALDADVYPEFGLAMSRLAHFAKNIIDVPAPDPASLDPRELLQMRRLGQRFHDFDGDLRYLNLKLMSMSAVAGVL